MLNCPCIRPPAYRIAESTNIFFELKKPGFDLVTEETELLTAETVHEKSDKKND